MQTVETLNEGLKRSYQVTIAADEIGARVEEEVKRIAPQVRMPGFRPGKVPANLVKKMHGEALQQDVLNTMVQQSVDNVISEKKLRPAIQPSVELGDGYEPGKDAEVSVSLEVLPEIEVPALDSLKLTRVSVEPSDEEVDEALSRLAEGQQSFDDAAASYKAKEGDQVSIDFEGKVDGTPFEGGKGEAMPVVIGSGQLIPGFEDQLKGLKKGDEAEVKVTFPKDYQAEELKGKDATFDIKVVAVKKPGETKLDDDFAKNFGLEGIDKLKELLKAQIEQELNGMTRTFMKRQLLDQLADAHDFDVPPSMADAEFNQIWQQLEQEAAREEDPEEARKEIESEKDDYRDIAERRVRLGLLLSEIGQANGVEISSQEMNMLMQQAAQRYPAEQREAFVKYVQQTPMAAAELRAPLYEDKVVDFLFEKAEIEEKTGTREELQEAIEAEPDEKAKVGGKKAPAKKAAAKKPAAKKAPAKKAEDEGEAKPAAKKPAAKKAPAKSAAKKSDEDSADAPAKKPAAKKPAAKKAPAKKAASKD